MKGGLTVGALLAGLLVAGPAATQQDFGETIEVRRVTVQVRALTPQGDAIEGLRPEDFLVRLGGREARVESADWIAAGTSATADIPPEELERAGIEPAPAEQLVVVFVQSSHLPSRMTGHMRMRPRLQEIVKAELARDNTAVAVVSFDSHLRLREDFTRDTELVSDALRAAWGAGGSENAARPIEPSLFRSIEDDDARRAATTERGLEVVADALIRLPGQKSLIFVGWGLGTLTGGQVRMGVDYVRARQALARAGIPVHVLDVTSADAHTLEIGLEQVAADTGGTYASTFRFPDQGPRRIVGALAGRYVLTVEWPQGVPDGAMLEVTLRDRRATLLVGPG